MNWKEILLAHGHRHVAEILDKAVGPAREKLEKQLEKIDFDELDRLIREYVLKKPETPIPADGGDPTSTEVFHLPECTLFSGKAVVYLRSTGTVGRTELIAGCEGLESAKIDLFAMKA